MHMENGSRNLEKMIPGNTIPIHMTLLSLSDTFEDPKTHILDNRGFSCIVILLDHDFFSRIFRFFKDKTDLTFCI